MEPTEKDRTLLWAVRSGYLLVVRQLLEDGVSVNTADNSGSTALMKAARFGLLEIVKLLVEKGADINLCDNSGSTALMKAAHFGRLEIVKLLVGKGADIDLCDNSGSTALRKASSKGHTKIVEFLSSEANRVAARYSNSTSYDAQPAGHGAPNQEPTPDRRSNSRVGKILFAGFCGWLLTNIFGASGLTGLVLWFAMSYGLFAIARASEPHGKWQTRLLMAGCVVFLLIVNAAINGETQRRAREEANQRRDEAMRAVVEKSNEIGERVIRRQNATGIQVQPKPRDINADKRLFEEAQKEGREIGRKVMEAEAKSIRDEERIRVRARQDEMSFQRCNDACKFSSDIYQCLMRCKELYK